MAEYNEQQTKRHLRMMRVISWLLFIIAGCSVAMLLHSCGVF